MFIWDLLSRRVARKHFKPELSEIKICMIWQKISTFMGFISIIIVVHRWKICSFIFYSRFEFLKLIVFSVISRIFRFGLWKSFLWKDPKNSKFPIFYPDFSLKIWNIRLNSTIGQILSHFGIQNCILEHFCGDRYFWPNFLPGIFHWTVFLRFRDPN